MAFTTRNLFVLAYANGFTLWHYKNSSDTLETIDQPGYFNDAAAFFASGDILYVYATKFGKAGQRLVNVVDGMVTMTPLT